MLDHMTLTVRDLARSKAFYQKVLKPLGYHHTKSYGDFWGFGTKQRPYFWIKPGKPTRPPLHIAFLAHSRKAVDGFHQAALAAGAEDNGGPGPREIYHPNYYGAFVLDPDGQPIEAVCHLPPTAQRKRK